MNVSELVEYGLPTQYRHGYTIGCLRAVRKTSYAPGNSVN